MDGATNATDVGAAFRRLRTQANVKLPDLATASDLSVSHLSRFERGERLLSPQSYDRLLAALALIAASQRAA